jgi:hypothetical protein
LRHPPTPPKPTPGLHHAVEDLCKLPALRQLFDAVHQLIMTTRGNKGLKRAYKSMCDAVSVSAPLKPRPDHRFGYGALEAQCVKQALRPLTMLYTDSSIQRQFHNVAGMDECTSLLVGTTLLGEGNNKFKLVDLLDTTLTTMQLLSDAIAAVQADTPMASMALPLWVKIIDVVAPLQASMRGRGAAAAAARINFIVEFLTQRREQYTTPELVAATLFDPANAILVADGVWRPPKDWFSSSEVAAAGKAVEQDRRGAQERRGRAGAPAVYGADGGRL